MIKDLAPFRSLAYLGHHSLHFLPRGRFLQGTEDKPTGADPRKGRSAAPQQNGRVDDSDGSAPLDSGQSASEHDRTASANDRAASVSDQIDSDSDQTASDSDQTASDSDQTASDSDQTASDEDQAASDQESAEGADQRIRDMASLHREHATHVRDGQSRARLRTATSRDITADKRAHVASTRDLIAELWDPIAKARDDAVEAPGFVRREGKAVGAARDRKWAAEDRASAAADRGRAAADRGRAAADRGRATEERTRSHHERTMAARDRAQAALDREESDTDELTHARRRGAGMEQLQREIDRARRAFEELVVTFVDVDGLKRVNDTKGHLAGDALLVAVADTLRERLRSYDLIMRFGGDEFVCALPNVDVKGVRQHFLDVSNALAAGPTKGSITVGFAELGDNDSAADLIRRADADLLAHREHS
jgi:diguanylate cyclase (GGDEF)-like protein